MAIEPTSRGMFAPKWAPTAHLRWAHHPGCPEEDIPDDMILEQLWVESWSGKSEWRVVPETEAR